MTVEPILPPEDLDRQAVDAIRGYVYQLYASTLAWIRLGPNEQLYIEVAEDYLVAAEGALRGVQVKDTAASGSVTLRSNGVVATLNSFWRLQAANPDARVQVTYLTTSAVGREQNSGFPDGVRGINHWRNCAREGTNPGALRAFLQALPLEPSMLDWLRTAGDDALREQLLRRIRWACDAPPLAELDQILREELVDLGAPLGLLPSDARKAESALLMRVLHLAATRGERRRLTRAQLLTVLEAATSISMPSAVLRNLITAVGTGANPSVVATDVAIDVRDVPALPLSVARQDLLVPLKSRLGQRGVLWLKGASGLGKTSLALELARTFTGRWSVIELRDRSGTTVADRLHLARAVAADPTFGGLILDDFPISASRAAELELRRILQVVEQADGAVVVTSYQAPPPTLAAALGADGLDVADAPHFNEQEVNALVSHAGGNPEIWGRTTYLFCGNGHPQLVGARVSGLRRRGWPRAELLDGVTPMSQASDVEAEREAIRARLVAELPERARTLLYRLSLLIGGFDRPLAMAVAAAAPTIGLPGESLDTLIGPWVERRTENQLRVSPLVSDAGFKVFAPNDIRAVHRAISANLAARNPFPAEQLGQLLTSALLIRDGRGLAIVAVAVLQESEAHERALAQELALLPYLPLDGPIFPEDRWVSALLRLAQLKVTLNAEPAVVPDTIYKRLLIEIDGLHDAEGLRVSAVFALLRPPQTPLQPSGWFALIRSLESHTRRLGAEELGELRTQAGISGDWTIAEFLFLWRATHLSSVAELEALFDVLDGAGPAIRTRYLGVLQDPYVGRQAMVQVAWVAEAERSGFDGRALAARYADLQTRAEVWGDETIAVECAAGRAVLISEYAGDHAQALAGLDEADRKWPQSPRLVRERAKILSRLGQHSDALVKMTTIIDSIPAIDPIGRVHALREMAISAATIGDPLRSIELFEAACAAAKPTAMMAYMAVALEADKAVAQFGAGYRAAALATYRSAVTGTDRLDPTTRRGAFIHFALAAVGAWMAVQLSMGADATPAIDFGACSRNPPDEMPPNPPPPVQAMWYRMAQIERKLGLDIGIAAETAERTRGAYIDAFERSRIVDDMRRCIREGGIGKASLMNNIINFRPCSLS